MIEGPESNEAIECPHCGRLLQRITMQRSDSAEGPRWYVLIAGSVNRAALLGLSKLLKGWAS